MTIDVSTQKTERLSLTEDYHCPSCGQALTMPAPLRPSRWRLGASPPRRQAERSPELIAAEAAYDRADAVARAAAEKLVQLEDDTTWERDSRGQITAGTLPIAEAESLVNELEEA